MCGCNTPFPHHQKFALSSSFGSDFITKAHSFSFIAVICLLGILFVSLNAFFLNSCPPFCNKAFGQRAFVKFDLLPESGRNWHGWQPTGLLTISKIFVMMSHLEAPLRFDINFNILISCTCFWVQQDLLKLAHPFQ